jgi:hypothetical protein
MDTPTLDQRIAAASTEGDWRTVATLNAEKLANLIARTDPATGHIAEEATDAS